VSAFSITATQGTTKMVTLVSSSGVATTQYGADGNPIRGAIVRYDDLTTLGLDYESQTFVSSTLGAMVDRRNTERTALANASPSDNEVVAPPAPKPTLVRTKLKTKIGGTKARAYDLSDGSGNITRLWYGNGLPLPPTLARFALAALEPAAAPGDDDKDNDDDDDDLHLSGDEGNGRTISPGIHPAGRQLLRVESITSAGTTVTYDASAVEKVTVPASTFAAPAGWTPRTLAPMASGPVGPAFDAPTPSTTTANVISAGTIAEHPEIYVLMWGSPFAKPENGFPVQQLARDLDKIISGSYTDPLLAYGVQKPRYMTLYVDGSDPPDSVRGSGSGAVVGTYVLAQTAIHPDLPPIWWEVGGHDPIFAVMVPAPTPVANDKGWSGFHFVVYNFMELVLPFPVSLFAHDSLPYQISKVYTGAFTVPFFIDPENRIYCQHDASQPGCADLQDFDRSTVAFSHELVETSTDPEPFLGWSDMLRGSEAWVTGEISDVCSQPTDPYPWMSRTLLGDATVTFMVATYWYQPHAMCVPASIPSVEITYPKDGSTIKWVGPSGTVVRFDGIAHDPATGDLPTELITWKVDGFEASYDDNGTLRHFMSRLSPGTHHIEASYKNAGFGTFVATADAYVFVVADPPVAYIDSPADGASIPNDQVISMLFHADDPQDGPLTGNNLVSWVSGAINTSHATGLSSNVPIFPGTLGDATITLQATNTANVTTTVTRTIHIVAATGKPTVSITSPSDGQLFLYPSEATITLTAAGFAPGAAPILDGNYKWTDSVDGDLTGTSRSITHAFSGSIMVGTDHTITVTVTDASGNTASATITITVGKVG
jgi:hypothetical protein